MSDNIKYYYLKLKDNYFDSEEMIILESMQDGYLYSNILFKLYLRSLKNKGRLMFNNRIPYNSTMLAQVTRHSVGVIEKAMKVFQELGLVEVLDSGAIYMTDIQNFIGKSSTEADRKREYRQKIDAEKNGVLIEGQISDKCPDKSPPEIELELERELERKKESQNKFSDESLEIQLSKHLYQKILENDPKAKEPKFEKWAEHVDKLMRIDGRTEIEIRQVIDFCQNDDFWKCNILSTKKLREKFSALLIKMKNEKGAAKKKTGMEVM